MTKTTSAHRRQCDLKEWLAAHPEVVKRMNASPDFIDVVIDNYKKHGYKSPFLYRTNARDCDWNRVQELLRLAEADPKLKISVQRYYDASQFNAHVSAFWLRAMHLKPDSAVQLDGVYQIALREQKQNFHLYQMGKRVHNTKELSGYSHAVRLIWQQFFFDYNINPYTWCRLDVSDISMEDYIAELMKKPFYKLTDDQFFHVLAFIPDLRERANVILSGNRNMGIQ